jgi:hypothetical protein
MPPFIAMHAEWYVDTPVVAELLVYPPIRHIKGYWSRLKNRYDEYAPLVDVEKGIEDSENRPQQPDSKSPRIVHTTKRVLGVVGFAAFAYFHVVYYL